MRAPSRARLLPPCPTGSPWLRTQLPGPEDRWQPGCILPISQGKWPHVHGAPGDIAAPLSPGKVASSDVRISTLEAAALRNPEGPTRLGSHPRPPVPPFPSPLVVQLLEDVLTLMQICRVSLSSQQSGLSLLYTGSWASSPLPPANGHFYVSSPGVPSATLCVYRFIGLYD